MGFSGFMRKVGHTVGKGLEFGGNVLRRLGDFGGSAAKFLGDHAGTIGNVAGAGAMLLGQPELAAPIVAGGQAIEKFAKSRPTQNTIRAVQDVGDAFNYGSQQLRT